MKAKQIIEAMLPYPKQFVAKAKPSVRTTWANKKPKAKAWFMGWRGGG